MNKTHLASVVLAALYPISHNNMPYQAGELLEVSAADAVFLKLSKCVREPTGDELKAYHALQNPVPITPVNNGTDDNELPQRTTATDEPDMSGGLQGHVIIDDPMNSESETIEAVELVEAPQLEPETVEPETIEPVVEAPQPETVEPEAVEAVEPETVEAVEPEAVTNPYDGWLKADLNAELDKRGIEHDAYARNDELEALLMADDANDQQADA